MTLHPAPEARPAGASISTVTRGDDWSPSAPQLPGPHQYLTLLKRYGRGAGREVWAAQSERRPGLLAIVEFLFQETAPPCPEDPEGDRFGLDLRSWAEDCWPAFALVTVLPARLPGTYGRFELLSFIGLGGMGQVWMAECPDYPDSPLAIKFFTHPIYRQHPALLEQCLQEAKVGINVNSPSIARTYQLLDLRAHQAEGWPPVALVMPLYEPSLQRVLEDLKTATRQLPRSFILDIARSLLDALDTLHSVHGFVHRDVKPSNVLFRLANNRPYCGPESLDGATTLLSDLGTLCRIGECPLFALGQDGWKAPELFEYYGSTIPNRNRVADPAEDLYALGKILEALTRAGEKLPPSQAEPIEACSATVPSLPDDTSDWLVQLTMDLRADAPERRLAAKTALRSRLSFREGSLGGPPVPHVGGYEILDTVGQGGMGIVYRARDLKLQRLVALKFIHPTRDRSEALQRFRTEAIAVASLNHPNIVQIYEIGERDDLPFFALEYCPGGSLEMKLRGTPLPIPEAANLVETLARAMHAAHERGIVHRDLKPANILFSADGAPKITDFGLAKLLGEEVGQTRTGAIMGTPTYMAPEQARGWTREVGPAVDVYSLGAILYQLLTGRPPFLSTTRGGMEILERVCFETPLAPRRLQSSVPRELEIICLVCLEKEPRKRYASARQLADDLDRYLAGQPITARPVGALGRMWLWYRRNRMTASLSLLLVLLLPLFLVFVLYAHHSSAWHAERQADMARNEAHSERILTARSAAGRGDWRTAMKLYQRAIDDRAADREQLEEERLPGLLAMNQVGQLLEILPGLKSGSPAILLLRGELDLADSLRREAGVATIRAARAHADKLSEADAAYAEALLSTNPSEQLVCLNRALRSDPFHHRANRAWLLLRVVRGEGELIQPQAEWFRHLFPDDPLPDFTEALTALIQGNEPAVQVHLTHFRARVEPELGWRVNQYLDQLKSLLAGLQDLDARDLVPWEVRWQKLTPEIRVLRDQALTLLRPLGMGGPTLGFLADTLEAVTHTAQPGGMQQVVQAPTGYPEALLPALEAVHHWELALRKRDRLPEVRRECEIIGTLAERAATAPTLLPRSPLRYQARVLAVLADLVLVSDGSDPFMGQLERLRGNLDRLVGEGRPWPKIRRQQLGLVCRMLAAGEPIHMAHADRWQARRELFHALGRRLLNDWFLDDSQNSRPLLLLAELHLAGENYQAALNAARRAAILAGEDRQVAQEARTLEKKAQAALIGLLKEMKE